jgi:hypothetical protein
MDKNIYMACKIFQIPMKLIHLMTRFCSSYNVVLQCLIALVWLPFVDNKGEWQSYTINVKINTLAQVDAYIGITLEISIVQAKHYCEEP